MMDINSLTIGQAREIATLLGQGNVDNSTSFEIGKPYLIRTVTMINTGRVVKVTHHEVVLEDAAWIADTGRFSVALKTGDFSEVEPFPDGRVILGRASIIDAFQIASTPRSLK